MFYSCSLHIALLCLSSNSNQSSWRIENNLSLVNPKPNIKTQQLGVIKTANGQVAFYVTTQFETVQAAIVLHGHSWVCFYDVQRRLVARYEVGSPDELPIKLVRNTLYFSYYDKNKLKKTFTQSVNAKLPDALCVAPDDCYTRKK
ncbi:hypothetical protein [Hymenobacter jeollabukensis]|uniref:Uncharacterized protein n=1 Tax=Hymenobacter jeollabukensis TaxID=2025313 RepID=A0A5R8WM86_9BACT|nr:hypothetical protein [Hymenobacter jeollabukensis]TLM90477.1 hypothetical protein FDY95_17330 [Hymenobacter jeollabukensis]